VGFGALAALVWMGCEGGGLGPSYKAAANLGVSAWGGKAGKNCGEDHGSAAGLLRRGGEEASKRGPRVSGRKKRARRGRNCWCAGPGRQGREGDARR